MNPDAKIVFDEVELQQRAERARGRVGTHTTDDINIDPIFTNTRINRSLSRARSGEFGRRLSRAESRSIYDNDRDLEAGNDLAIDLHVKQSFDWKQTFLLAYQSIGVIYGDIGTSPLYVFSGIFSSDPETEDLVGALSLIIWSLLIMVTLKYVIIILHADNNGEGGTFSTYSLLTRYANIAEHGPSEKRGFKMQRHLTDQLPRGNSSIRNALEKSRVFRGVLQVIGVLAVSMVMSDGVLTPAQSVLGAVQGLNVATTVSNGTVVGVTCAILIVLFLFQPFGTEKIAFCFAPIIILWLGLNGGIGIYNLAKYDWTVLRAFNPGLAFLYLIRNGRSGWLSLGGVLLCFTGVEALFADLGAFSMTAIQLSWLCWCLPMLLLTYTGQAAYISVNPDAYQYPVFYTVPSGWVIPMIVFACLASIVASQAIITATFQLIAQITKLSYFPTIKVIHTSKRYHNQLYVPLANWLLMIGTVLIAAIYNNTTSLGNAYGVCVMFVTFFDTCMVSLVALLIWKKPWWLVMLPALAIACMDGSYLSAALTKVPDGAWFTITLASVLAAFFILWRFGKENQWKAESHDRQNLSRYIRKQGNNLIHVVDKIDDGTIISRSRGFSIFFDKVGTMTPIVFSEFVDKLDVIPDIFVFLNIRPLEQPTVEDHYRVQVIHSKPFPNCYRVILRHGFMETPVTDNLAHAIYTHIKTFLENGEKNLYDLERPGTSQSSALQQEIANEEQPASADMDNLTAETTLKESKPPAVTEVQRALNEEAIRELTAAFESRVVYVVGKEDLKVKAGTPIWRRVLLSAFLFVRHNTRNKMANLKLPVGRLIEIGFLKQI